MVKKSIIDVSTLHIDKNYSKVSDIHKYWSRKPWFVIEKYIEKFTQPNDLVLDQFVGSGSTGLETILKGRNFIGFDLNPIALKISDITLKIDFNEDSFLKDFEEIKKELKQKVMDLYKISNEEYILYRVVGHKGQKNRVKISKYDIKKTYYSDEENSYLIPEPNRKDFSFPDRKFPTKFYKDRFSYKGVTSVSDLFSSRNLYASSLIRNALEKYRSQYSEIFMLALSNTILHATKLKSENVRPLGVNNYWIPDDYIEENVWWRFEDRINRIRKAKKAVASRKDKKLPFGEYKLIKETAQKLNLEDNSIDYIFTDPPYGDVIQYSELSYVWNTWLEDFYDEKDEIIINPKQTKDKNYFMGEIKKSLQEAFRVLKNEKFMTLCFQNKQLDVWFELSRILKDIGFELYDISVYDVLGNPYNKNWAKFSPKSDFYITFRKSNRKIINTKFKIIKVSEILEKHLKANGDMSHTEVYDSFVTDLIESLFKYDSVTIDEKLDIKSLAQRMSL